MSEKRPILKLRMTSENTAKVLQVKTGIFASRKGDFFAYAIYGPNQREHPGKYVVRKWQIKAGDCVPLIMPHAVSDSVHAARLAVPFGLELFPRQDGDDPSLIETWM